MRPGWQHISVTSEVALWLYSTFRVDVDFIGDHPYSRYCRFYVPDRVYTMVVLRWTKPVDYQIA